ncbi:hypothetical protein [Salipaludibacillus daqingensis]|uniref:hypothetical protein n=1 Tax=Salipaludibacillus daqingensis TaxID=3041001 RepID=UPI002476B3E2|nr:hypothetical protein [Salipaludibacillus daqingensis]
MVNGDGSHAAKEPKFDEWEREQTVMYEEEDFKHHRFYCRNFRGVFPLKKGGRI